MNKNMGNVDRIISLIIGLLITTPGVVNHS